MRKDVVEKLLATLSTLYVDKTIKKVIYDKEVQEFYLVLDDGTKILI